MDLSLKLLGVTNVQLFSHRRFRLKSFLNAQYQDLCQYSQPMDWRMFGPDVKGSIRNITELNKVSKKIVKQHQRSTRDDFLGRGRRQSLGPVRDTGTTTTTENHNQGHNQSSQMLLQAIADAVSIPFSDTPVRLKLFQHWFKISNDREIRDMVSGMHITIQSRSDLTCKKMRRKLHLNTLPTA